MTNEHDLETTVRDVLQTVSELTPVAPDLAERMIPNASSGRPAVVPLRLAHRFTIPLLAAAACIVVIVAVVLGGRFAADRSVDPPAVIQPTPTAAPPTGGPSSAATSAPSSSGPSTSRASTSNRATGSGSTTIGSSKTGGQPNSPVTVLPPSSGAPAGFQAAALDFLDVKTGWALGDAQCATGTKTSCPALIHTDDGGASWHLLTIPVGLASAELCSVAAADIDCVFRLEFADQHVGYLWGGTTMFVTVDGGAQWKRIPTAEPIGSVAVVHGHLLRVMGDHGDGSVRPKPAVIETSPVGSTSFSVMSFPIPGVSVLDLSVLGAGPDTAYAVAYASTRPEPYIFRITDGVNLMRWPVGDTCGLNGANGRSGPTAATDGALIYECGGAIAVVPHSSTVPGPQRKVPTTRTRGGDSNMWTIEAVISANDFAIVNEESALSMPPVTSWHHTRDGGTTWDPPVEFSDSFAEYSLDRPSIVTAPGGLFGISTDKAALQFSLDGGTTWQSRTF